MKNVEIQCLITNLSQWLMTSINYTHEIKINLYITFMSKNQCDVSKLPSHTPEINQ